MAHLNKISLTGTIHKEPEMRESICKITLINKIGWGDKEQTNWFRCIAFGKKAEFISKYLHDRSPIWLTGQVQLKKYNDKYYTEVVIDDIGFNGKVEGTTESKGNQKPPAFDDCQDDFNL